jgi:hypothetical protein
VVSEASLPAVLEAALRRCRTICRETLERYDDDDGTLDREFAAALLTVVAAVDVALDAPAGQRRAAVAAAAQTARSTAALIRRYGLDEQILRCAAACEELLRRSGERLDRA